MKKEQLILINEKQEGEKKEKKNFLKLWKPKKTFKTKNNKEKSLKIIKKKHTVNTWPSCTCVIQKYWFHTISLIQ